MTMSSVCRDFPVHTLCWSDLSETAHRSVPSCKWTQSSWHHSLHFVFFPHIELGLNSITSTLRLNCPNCELTVLLVFILCFFQPHLCSRCVSALTLPRHFTCVMCARKRCQWTESWATRPPRPTTPTSLYVSNAIMLTLSLLVVFLWLVGFFPAP